MAGFDDLVNKGKDALNSEQGEQMSDQALDGASDFANRASGGKFEEQINQGRDAADQHIGQTGAGAEGNDQAGDAQA